MATAFYLGVGRRRRVLRGRARRPFATMSRLPDRRCLGWHGFRNLREVLVRRLVGQLDSGVPHELRGLPCDIHRASCRAEGSVYHPSHLFICPYSLVTGGVACVPQSDTEYVLSSKLNARSRLARLGGVPRGSDRCLRTFSMAVESGAWAKYYIA